jgi:hypothetical protein
VLQERTQGFPWLLNTGNIKLIACLDIDIEEAAGTPSLHAGRIQDHANILIAVDAPSCRRSMRTYGGPDRRVSRSLDLHTWQAQQRDLPRI